MQLLKQVGVLLKTSLSVTSGLLGLLALTLGNCAMAGNSTVSEQRIPQFLQLIELPNEVGTEKFAVIPGGYAYVMNWSGSIGILDGPKLVQLLHFLAESDRLSGDVISNPQTGLVYVADSFNRNIHIIQGTKVITTLSTANFVPLYLAVAPNVGLIYVGGSLVPDNAQHANQETLPTGVRVLKNTQVITHIPTGNGPAALGVDQAKNRLYAGLVLPSRAYAKSDFLMAVIEGTKLITTTTLGYDTREMGEIRGVAVNQQSGEVYLLQNQGTVIYWHGERVERIKIGKPGYYGTNFIAVDSTRNLAYVGIHSDPPSSPVAVIQENQVIATLRVGFDPQYAVYDETHDYLYITNYRSGTLSVIRGTEIVATLDTHGEGAWFIGVDEVRGYIYVSNADSHNVAVFGFPEAQPSFWQRFLPLIGR